MKRVSEPLPGFVVYKPFVHEDARGAFVKTFHEEQLAEIGIHLALREEFFSTSARGVVRGMHFQLPPHAHAKLVYCISGAVLDVVLDIRTDSPAYGRSAAVELSAANRLCVFIPPGFAHGFASLEDGSTMVYKTDCCHAPGSDAGILWNSFGFDWPFKDPLISPRDAAFPTFAQFSSPFTT